MTTQPNATLMTPIQPEAKIKQRSLWGAAARRFRRNRLAMVGLVIVMTLLFLAVFADIVSPYSYIWYDFSLVNLHPFIDPAHPLGADNIGRDFLARLIFGARTSLLVGLSVPIIGFSIGVPLGILSGYQGGRLDYIIMRIVEIFTAIPPLLLALFLLSLTGNGVGNVIFVLALTSWIEPTRLSRAQFLTFRETEFVTAARGMGATDLRVVFSHVLPNALTPLLVSFTFAVPGVIFAEAGLSFLGIGITDPIPSWGKMVGGTIGSTIRVHPHLAIFPTILVALTMLGFSFVGDGLQEALDPRRSR